MSSVTRMTFNTKYDIKYNNILVVEFVKSQSTYEASCHVVTIVLFTEGTYVCTLFSEKNRQLGDTFGDIMLTPELNMYLFGRSILFDRSRSLDLDVIQFALFCHFFLQLQLQLRSERNENSAPTSQDKNANCMLCGCTQCANASSNAACGAAMQSACSR